MEPPQRTRPRRGAPLRLRSLPSALAASLARLRSDPLLAQARNAGERFSEWIEGRRLKVAGCTAAAGLVIVPLAVWAAAWDGDGKPDCPPPLELRVLTSPESRDTLADAAAAFERSKASRSAFSGCRDIRLTVYSASSDNVAEGFTHLDTWNGAPPASEDDGGEEFQPLTRVGPQPDIWIPDTRAELQLVSQSLKPRGLVELSTNAPSIAYSPLVLGLPAELAPRLPPGSASGSWNDLLDAVADLPEPPPLLRPGPTTSGAGLLHTIGRYLAADGTLPGDSDDVDKLLQRKRTAPIERRLSTSGYPAEDSSALLGTLKDKARTRTGGLDNVGVLVSEKALVDFNESDDPGTGQPAATAPQESGGSGRTDRPDPCSSFRPEAAEERLTAYYPKGVPALDHPFVRVSWLSAGDDTARRARAVEAFRRWLLGDEGQDLLARAHYRPAEQGGSASPAPDAGSPLGCTGTGAEPESPVHSAEIPQPHIEQVLHAYEQARASGRVLVLFDVSPSMREGSKNREAERVVDSALGVLGPNDTFGVWAYPKSDSDPIGHRDVVPLGAERPEIPDGLHEVRVTPLGVTTGAALYEVLGEAVDEMRRQAVGDGEKAGKQAILLVTDRGDDKIGGRDLEREREKLYSRLADADAPRVPILVADVSRPGCDPDLQFIARFSSESSECLPSSQDVAKKLANLLAVVEQEGGTP